jgi:hypothetical protein
MLCTIEQTIIYWGLVGVLLLLFALIYLKAKELQELENELVEEYNKAVTKVLPKYLEAKTEYELARAEYLKMIDEFTSDTIPDTNGE